MILPFSLSEALKRATESWDFSHIRKARRDLSRRYRANETHTFITDDAERLSYILTRMPATYAVGYTILQHLSEKANKISSLLDLGAGPATMLWAAHTLFPSLNHVTLIEQDHRLVEMGMKLLDETLKKKHIHSIRSTLMQAMPFTSHDLVTLSYVLGELRPDHQHTLMDAAWKAATGFLVLIEPGTPKGFERMRKARDQLIEQGAFILAPCPHQRACPMTGKDWCHFSKRLTRTSLHRIVKEAPLGYEDEKYSYIIAARNPVTYPVSRIIRKPRKSSGHFTLDLCTPDGLKRVMISRKNQELYKAARHLEWGDIGPRADSQNNE